MRPISSVLCVSCVMVLPCGVLASEFSVEAKNISLFGREHRDFFAEISKGGPYSVVPNKRLDPKCRLDGAFSVKL